VGELAALATSFFWSVTSLQFTLAGRRVGSPVVNRVRLLLAVLYLSLAHLVLQGELWPVGAAPYRWLWLGLSGVVGLVLGDASLFQAFVVIGPRRAMLLMTLVPVITTGVAWIWLGEILRPVEILAVLLTVGGVAWVVSEQRGAGGRLVFPGDANRRTYALGVFLGLGGALGQALGLILSKQGLQGDFSPLSATVMRMLVATVVIWLLATVQGRLRATRQALRDQRGLMYIIGGAVTGPFLGVWFSMIAVQNAPVGIASTLMALPPVILIPLTRWIFDERITARAVVGTLIALTGVALIFLG
jgi:drug/metabolite transporter (DMT)-like permease